MKLARPHRYAAKLLLSVSLVAGMPTAWAATLEGIRVWRAPDHTRLVFDLSAPVEHKVFRLQNPQRLVVDVVNTNIVNAAINERSAGLDLARTPIADLRTAVRNGRDLRIVLDLSAEVNPRSFVLGRNEQYGDRLVVDLYDTAVNTAKTVADVVATDNKSGGKLRDIVVAIDAGHGGDDPGAIGPNRLHEKKVVLDISRELKRLFDAEPGFRAMLVRDGDYYIALRNRTHIARKNRADIFISVHADGFLKASANGASVYALSRRGATSETARYLAQRENRTDLIGGVGAVSLNDKDDMLASVLLDLSMTATLDSSLEIGGKVLRSVGTVARLHKNQVEQAGFMVLKSPDIPSILVETGFISNPEEARRLGQADYQRKMARAIFGGVKEYFQAKPPVGSLLASRHKSSDAVYIIARGDTLSGIAQRHRVSVNALQKHNNLQSTQVRIGQRLKIPSS